MLCNFNSSILSSVALDRPDLQVDEVFTNDGLPLRGAGLVEGPRLLLGPGHVLRGRPAQYRADDVLVPFVYRLKLSSRVTFESLNYTRLCIKYHCVMNIYKLEIALY